MFSLSLDVDWPTAVITLRGHLNEAALTDLGTLLDGAIANDYSPMIVDLVDLDSLALPGLALIAGAARRLAEGGRRLSIRSPSAPIHRQLVAEGLGDHILDEQFVLLPEPAGQQSGAVDQAPDGDQTPERPARSDKVSALPTDDDLVDATLRLVVELARATVGGADGVSVSLRRHGRLATVAASDQTVLDMDAQQYATGEGPCVDASNKGRWFHTQSLGAEDRWPDFTPRAMALGIRAILSSPLVAWGQPVGALNIYSRQASAFATDDQRLAMKFATEVSAILTDAGVDATDDQRSERFQASLRSRQVIAQAQGVLMERRGVSEEQAFTVLRVHSQRTGMSLRARAEEITASTRPPPPQPGPGPGPEGRRD
jgi:anti-anti-sigma factor